MDAKTGGAAIIVVGLLIAAALFYGLQGIKAEIKEGAEEQVEGVEGGGILQACPDDGYSDLNYQWVNKENASADARQTDIYIFKGSDIVYTSADASNATYGDYAQLADRLLCGKGTTYTVYLGDESEEYYRDFEVTPSDAAIYKSVDSMVVGNVTWTGYEDGTAETADNLGDGVNVTLGSGEATSDLQLKFKEDTLVAGLEANDGLMVIFGFNGTSYDNPEITNNAAEKTSCPQGAAKLVSQDDHGDGSTVCYVISTTQLGEYSSVTLDLKLSAKAGVDPSGVSNDNIDVTLADENRFVNSDAGNTMDYGYFDEDDSDIGATSLAKAWLAVN